MSSYKRFNAAFTPLEQLSNELFLEIFDYLTNVDIVYSFSQLNTRFQTLILNYCHTFDFKSISKSKIDIIIQQHHPKYWRSLRLSNDNETPGQIEVFSRLYPFDQYLLELKSISFIHVQSNTHNIFLSQLHSLIHLVSLTMKSVCGKYLSQINLPSLKHLVVSSCAYGDWMMNFPHLENLEHTIEGHSHFDLLQDSHNEYDLKWPRTLKQLKINFDEKTHGIFLRKLIYQLSDLVSLKICVANGLNTFPYGLIWEELITLSLLSLEKFQFYFTFNLPADVDKIIASFSTPFYLYKKRCFIRCDISILITSACLYSLPFAFEHFSVHTLSFDTSITTLLNNNNNNANKNMYKNVKTLTFYCICSKPHSTLRPDNINELIVNVSILPKAWLPMLTQLRHLSLGREGKMSSANFICLLKNAPKLYHLTIDLDLLMGLTVNWSNPTVCKLLSDKIRRLDLGPTHVILRNYIETKDLQNLVRIFGINCESLTLNVKSHRIIETYILPYMKKLRSLNVSGIFKGLVGSFVMNSVEQWQISGKYPAYVSANWNGVQIWFDN